MEFACGIGMLLIWLAGLLGWIVPLVIGLGWRRRNVPGFQAWTRFAAIWGGTALVLAAGIGVMLAVSLSGNRHGSYSPDKTSEFSAATFKGPTGNLKIPFSGEMHLKAECSTLGVMDFSTSNSTFVVPAGRITVKSLEVTARDKQNRKWMAQGNWFYSGEHKTNVVEVPAGGIKELAMGPPFRASIQVTYSPVSDSFRMKPLYSDSLGYNYKVCSDDRKGTVPGFELLDSENKLVMSGKFEFG